LSQDQKLKTRVIVCLSSKLWSRIWTYWVTGPPISNNLSSFYSRV